MRGIARKKALEIIKNYPRSGVLVVGDVMVDHFIWGRVSRISPEAPVPVVDVQKDSVMLGGCANVLNAIYAMGGRVFVAGVIGEDDIGRGLVSQLQERRIDTKGILVEKARPTTLKTRIVAHGQQVSASITRAASRSPTKARRIFSTMPGPCAIRSEQL